MTSCLFQDGDDDNDDEAGDSNPTTSSSSNNSEDDDVADQQPPSFFATSAAGTLSYVGPEVLLQMPRSGSATSVVTATTTAIDIWAAGCVMAEILTRKILFNTDNPLHLVSSVVVSAD